MIIILLHSHYTLGLLNDHYYSPLTLHTWAFKMKMLMIVMTDIVIMIIIMIIIMMMIIMILMIVIMIKS